MCHRDRAEGFGTQGFLLLTYLGATITSMLATDASMLLSQECTRVLGVLASPLCPMQAQYLQQPLLGKVIAYLKLRMKAS